MHDTHYPFVLPPLPYGYEALEPALDARTLGFHHDKHFATYVDNLNKLLADQPAYQNWPLEKLVRCWEELPPAIRQGVRNNAGGVYNHDLYFQRMCPPPVPTPDLPLQQAIDRDFGSLADLKTTMKAAALGQFGSGYAWLVHDQDGQLSIRKTPNQDTPLPLTPLLCCDVWEHAYYLQYQNRRGDYFDAWWRLVNWPLLSQQYGAFLIHRPRFPTP